MSEQLTVECINSRKYLRPDHQMFDEVRIHTTPRFKQSGLSGNEWRYHAEITFLCKGKVMHRRSVRDIETACAFVGAEYHLGCDKGREDIGHENQFCDQEGCQGRPSVFYKMKTQHNSEGRPASYQFEQYRSFCEFHSKRGDQDFNDCDANYERVYPNQPTKDGGSE